MSNPIYPLTAPRIDLPAPGSNTDILPEDVVLPPGHKGFMKVSIQVALVTSGLFKLVDKPREDLDSDDDVLGAKATGSIQAIASSLLADGDYFTLKDGTHTVLFEVERVRAATGQITAIPGEDLIAGETFTIDDGVNDPVVFEFVADAEDIADPANVPIEFDGTELAEGIAALMNAAINGAADLDVASEVDEAYAGRLLLTNELAGIVGNAAIADTVADTDFAHTGMSGGLGTVGVTGGRTAVTVDPAATAAEVVEAIVDAVNGVGAGLTITASVDEDDATKVALVNDDFGVVGNIANTENVSNAGFTVSGMSGGYGGATVETLDLNGTSALAAGAVYVKEYLLHSSRQYNFQVPTDSVIKQLYVGGLR